MATLVRPREATPAAGWTLDSSIPAPFPSLAERQSLLNTVTDTQQQLPEHVLPGPSRVPQAKLTSRAHSSAQATTDLMPSIAHVEKSCLMTLNNLLSVPDKWHPIVPDRRHSMPSPSPTALLPATADSSQSSSALHTLVSNLRNVNQDQDMMEIGTAGDDAALLRELCTRIDILSPTLLPADALLARTLVSLLSHFHRLSDLQHSTNTSSSSTAAPTPIWSLPEQSMSTNHIYDTLHRQLSDFQTERQSSQHDVPTADSPPTVTVEIALLWTRIDDELDAVVSMCKTRAEDVVHLPPQYEPEDYEFDSPPQYDPGTRPSFDDAKSPAHVQNEKMRMDLDAVTMAIDRLYLVAPQLHNQRVELKSSKVAQMERASRASPASSVRSKSKGKQKATMEDDFRDLEHMFDLLGKASARSLKDQSVVLDGGMQSRLEKARQRDNAKREAFVDHLVEHSNAGRYHGQDAVLHPTRVKDPEAMLTLPEFIREAIPSQLRVEDPTKLLSLPEFVKELPPPDILHAQSTVSRLKKRRSRSLSAPSLSWFRASGSRASISRQDATGFSVSYVAEYHENLQHIMAFVTATGATPGVDIEAEVLRGGESERLVIKSGAKASLPLSLPARTSTGKKDVKVQSGHYEVKLPVNISATSTPAESPPLLDATQLSVSNPTTFICASCSLPLVQSSKISEYRDLPSEHWEELVDAWMCHSEQHLHDQVAKHGRGFWPQAGQALVGGSYILFEHSNVVTNNLTSVVEAKGEEWRLTRCLCGAVTGRVQEHPSGEGNAKTDVYRMLKYAIRPVSNTVDPVKIPLSAFIVEDMLEFVQAHATYRFILLDEEDERPRMLVWLFKPSIRLSYTTPTQYAIPKSASIHAAKVLYKIVGPAASKEDLKTILNQYPGFPQAEYLFYPMSVCRRLAGALAESNSAYPQSMQTMTGLDVGWLQRG